MKKLILLCLVAVLIFSLGNQARAEDWTFQDDKQLHFAGGLAEGVIFQTFYEFSIARNYPSVTPWKRHLYAFGLTFITGSFFNVFKELTDETFSTADLAYGTGGLCSGAGGTILIFRFTGDFKNWKFGM